MIPLLVAVTPRTYRIRYLVPDTTCSCSHFHLLMTADLCQLQIVRKKYFQKRKVFGRGRPAFFLPARFTYEYIPILVCVAMCIVIRSYQ